MRMDKLTARFQQALGEAQSLAIGRDNQILEPAHVLLALLEQQGGTVRPLVLKAAGNLPKLRADLQAALDKLPKVEGAPADIHVSNDLTRLLNVTDKLAQQKGDQFISSELFVLACFEDKGLLAPRRISGARVYTRRDRARLALILRSKAIGASLGEIKHFLDLYGAHGEGRMQQMRYVVERTDETITELETKRAHIEALLSELRLINQRVREALATAAPKPAPRR